MAKKTKDSSGTINVNTTNVRTAVNTLSSINDGIETDFSNVKTAINKLNASWDGTASNSAMSEFSKIKSTYCGSSGRKSVMKNYINFLKNSVAIDYEGTEKKNTELASLFK